MSSLEGIGSGILRGCLAIIEREALHWDHEAAISHHDAEIQAARLKAEALRAVAVKIERSWRDTRSSLP